MPVQEHNIYGIVYRTPEIPSDEKIDLSGIQKFKRIDIPDIFDDLEFDEDGTPVYDDIQTEFITD